MGPDGWSAVADLIVAVAAAVGALAAWRGLKTWKDQNKWQVNSDLARRVLVATYRYRDAVWDVRRRTFTKSEMTTGTVLPGSVWQSPDGTRLAIERRWNDVGNARLELSSVLLEAEVFWGDTLKEPFSKMLKEERRLNRASRLFLQTIDDRLEKSVAANAHQRIKEEGGIHFEKTENDDDEFRSNFNSLIEDVEKVLRKKMEINVS
jgi:hypothetical protein